MVSRWVGESVGDDDGSNVDELFNSLGLDATSPDPEQDVPVGDQPPDRRRSSRSWLPLVAALGVLLVALIGAAAWFGRSSADETDTALETITTEGLPAATIETEAEKLKGILGGLGFDAVAVEVQDEKVVLSGSVPTDQDVTAIRNAVISSSDPVLVDMNGITVGGPAYGDQGAGPAPGQPAPGQPAPGQPAPGQPGAPRPAPPGAPPPGFVPPTPEQRADLQAELNRVLTDTPLVFDPGSTELNALQLRVLDTTVIGLLESHPGVPVRLVGYTDESGSDFDNSLLSFDRAEAVRDYLISRGVPEFILRAEGRGEDDASGDSGADRRVEIEVIEG
ncbi:MAG: OmpA family protein [Acidimicrobiales bacterium]